VSRNLDAIFQPRSIAVIGASQRHGTVGNDVIRNLVLNEFQGTVYPVNIKGHSILGIHSYKTISDIPGEVDLAVIIIPSKFVLETVDECIAKGVKGFIVISAGFKETGSEGAELERALRDKVREAGLPLIGPNCLGVVNTDVSVSMNASFAGNMPKPGNLAFISQSGALCTSVLDFAEEREMGFSKFVSFGNKADVNSVDLLEYLANDEKTKVIAMYIEDVGDGRRFIETVRDIFWRTGKPILALKSGRSAEGAQAVSSHTGSLAGSDEVYDALFKQSGVQRVDTVSELFDYAMLYTTQPMPEGKRLAIITNAGGPGIMATDAAVRHGLSLAELSEETRSALKASPVIPPTASLRNPVDVIGDAQSDRYEAAIRIVLEDPNVDMGLIILTPQSMTDVENVGKIVPRVIEGIEKPIVCSFMGAATVREGVETLRESGIPNYAFPESAIKALAAANRMVEMRIIPDREEITFDDIEDEKVSQIIADALADDDECYMSQADCRPIFEAYNLPLLGGGTAHTPEEAADIAEQIDRPVVMKVMSADVIHKSDSGGVLLGINGREAAIEGYARIYDNIEKSVPGAKIDGILIEEMARKGVEVILGCVRQPGFGPMMMFGLGGTMVEVLKDVTFRLAPMWKVSAERMVRQIKAFKMLDGFRGEPEADVESIIETMLRLSTLAVNHPEIAELDINPLIVHATGMGCSLADSRIMLKKVAE